ncbi:MAG: hypothetical protein P1P63_00795 [Treponemataceae bacterium]
MTQKKRLFFLLVVGFTALGFLSAQTAEQKKLLLEYEALLNRVQYATQCGFCFDGKNHVGEEKTKGSEHSFFVAEQNVYLQVKNKKTGAIYYTRSFDLVDVNGSLAVNADYVVTQNIRITGHWNFFKMGKKLNVTVCTDNTCKNTEIDLYEINAKPVAVTDGVFLTFAKGVEKKAQIATVSINAKGVPVINLANEKKNAEVLLKKIKKTFSQSEYNKMQADLNATFTKAIN